MKGGVKKKKRQNKSNQTRIWIFLFCVSKNFSENNLTSIDQRLRRDSRDSRGLEKVPKIKKEVTSKK